MTKNPLCLWRKSPLYMATREPYVYDKRALCLWQKSPMPTAKEPYVYGKRALTLLAQAYRGDFLDACWHIAFALHYAAAQNAGC